MIIYNFYVFGVRARPAEAHSKLIVHTDAVLITTVTFKSFQPVARRNTQVSKSTGQIELLKLSACYTLYMNKAGDPLSVE
jgi:hypothetical protein